MAEFDNLNKEYIIQNIVDDAVIRNADTVTIPAFQFRVTMGARVMCQVKDSRFILEK
jgi:hypothetical protein